MSFLSALICTNVDRQSLNEGCAATRTAAGKSATNTPDKERHVDLFIFSLHLCFLVAN